eukprot:bmy_17681T0
MAPANSFVGAPYWMAPEVILAMDEGAVRWQGITRTELAEWKPPLFHTNAMSALHHTAHSESPALQSGHWSEYFRNFVDSCLQKIPQDRPTSEVLLKHCFVLREQPPAVITDLIQRTKDAVRELDNLQGGGGRALHAAGRDTGRSRSPPARAAQSTAWQTPLTRRHKALKPGRRPRCRRASAPSSPTAPSSAGCRALTASVTTPARQSHLQPRVPHPPPLLPADGATAAAGTALPPPVLPAGSAVRPRSVNRAEPCGSSCRQRRQQHQKQLRALELRLRGEPLGRALEGQRAGFGAEAEKLSGRHQATGEKAARAAQAEEGKFRPHVLWQQKRQLAAPPEARKRTYKLRKEPLKEVG